MPAFRRQSVNFHSAELEALEARIRATEARLKEVSNEPPRKTSPRRSPLAGARAGPAGDVGHNKAEEAQGQQRHQPNQQPQSDEPAAQDKTVKALAQEGDQTDLQPVSRTPSHLSKEYVMVDRPAKDQTVAS